MHKPCTSTQTPSILPLPDHVAAQIRSSTAIMSLSGIVLELVKNALDADATRLEITIDYARGACTVQDDGLGIPPLEFREEGGLGKLHWTSKYEAHRDLFGRNGTSLASLGAVSLLSIVSRHHQHRSHNAITLHHTGVVERQLPASSQHEIDGKHGTRVVVRNLFGNLPVRVKQRSKVAAQKAESERLWHSFKMSLVGLLLSWARPVSVKVRDTNNRIVFAINTSDLKQPSHGKEASSGKRTSSQLTSMLNILTQASYLSVAQWPSWVPISASTSELYIKGAISLEPSPTKNMQFISLGSHPLISDREHNELYDEVNRLFHFSDFGGAESDAQDGPVGNDSDSKTRSKEVGSSNRHMNIRKAVDKYPMFHLRISPRDGLATIAFGQRFIDNKTNLQSTIDVLQAMIMQWLSTHHFCPKQPRERTRPMPHSSAGRSGQNTMSRTSQFSTQAKQSASDSASSIPSKTSTSATSNLLVTSTRKRKLSSVTAVPNLIESRQSRAFADWSRIKSSSASFFTNIATHSKPGSTRDSLSGRTLVDFGANLLTSEPKVPASTPFTSQPHTRGVLNVETPNGKEHELATDNRELDDAILWTDPSTRRTHSINARTGFFQPTVYRRSISDTVNSNHSIRTNSVQSLRLPSRMSTSAKTPWLSAVMNNWDNPVFKSHERPIEQALLHGSHPDQDSSQSRHTGCSHPERTTSCTTHSVRAEKLTNESLLTAQVLGQVDRKFILIKATRLDEGRAAPGISEALLVLIDQHAADERIQVENLLRELCSPVNSDEPRFRSKLGHSAEVACIILEKPVRFSISRQEGIHFTTFAGTFASWGILFDILDASTKPDAHGASPETSCLLTVTALPPSVSERCRADTGLLISFLRSTVWDYASDPVAQVRASFTREQRSPYWIGRLARCPKRLIDMVNSRACRSAIMFNDELRLDECQNLVRTLAGCVFPFVCAHGRPSLVPLADVESMAHGFQAADVYAEPKTEAFVQAWKQWKT